MGLIGSSDSGHHRSAKDAVVSARAGSCRNTVQVMLRSKAAAWRHRAAEVTRAGERLTPPLTDQNPLSKNNDMDPPTDNRSVKGEPGPQNGNAQAPRKISLGRAISATN